MSLKGDHIREIIVYGDYFWAFYKEQSEKVKEKINWTIGLVRDLKIIPERYFKHISGTDLYEIRVILGNNIYRIFCFFDHSNLVILLNGFQKKSQKTPRNEIDLAKKLKRKYYEAKEK